MYFYKNEKPIKNSIIIGELILEEETDDCFYVFIPEYNNIKGRVLKTDYPKKIRTRNRIFSVIRKKKRIACIVNKVNSDIIELGVRDIDKEQEVVIINRLINIRKIIKIILYISLEYNIDYNILMETLHKTTIKPLLLNDMGNIDISSIELLNVYENYLRDIDSLIKDINIDIDIKDELLSLIKDKLLSLVKYGNSDTHLDFKIMIWDTSNDEPIYYLRKLFEHIITKHIKIRYIGSPKYQIYINNVKTQEIDNIYNEIKDKIILWLNENKINNYDFDFDINKKYVKQGDVSIKFPYKININ